LRRTKQETIGDLKYNGAGKFFSWKSFLFFSRVLIG